MAKDTFELAGIVDQLLESAVDDPVRLAILLDDLDENLREEVLVSDFLNALQVFVYHFREEPSALGAERLILHAGSDAVRGIVFEEIDIYALVFRVEMMTPVIEVRAGDDLIARFAGGSAYREAIRAVEGMP